ncbi:Gfo/Idh/MocA family protein [Bosea lathyri]|uniref:Predicted dehydrogenase n=1 Tax=Bosea lathyri TaxID=1036778 RepID=A0A1H6C6Q3_9HYPH|nr:Gfo/Idh/MocA family oxidoreductase [Bosea lathyri]SEG68649.1 Predicted dehydrogenase [Bosea lathyri]
MTLTVAIAGCGYFSRFHQDAWSRMDGVRVVGVADRDAGKREAAVALFDGAKAFDDAEAMLDAVRPDLIDIVTPPQTHRALVEAAARRGVKMICQKPLAPAYDEAQAIVGLAEEAGVMLAVHENFRFMPWFMEAGRLITSGAVGTPLNISFRLRPGDGQGHEAYLSRQPYFQSMPRFLIHETGIHLIDVFRCLMGEITGVFARLRRINPVIAGEDAGYVIFDFASGAAGLFDGNRHVDHPAKDTRMTNGVLLVEGTESVIRLDGFGKLFVRPRGGDEREHAYAWADRGYGGDCVYRQSRHIVDHLLTGTPLANSGRDYLRNLDIEEAVYRSAAEGRFITV